MENQVKVLGFLNDEEVSDLYQGSVGFIYPSLIEGFGFQGLEAIASGTLLLASDISVFREIYGDNAIYFDPNNSNSISDAIKKVLEIQPSERLRIITRGQKFIKKYSWEKTAKEALKAYESFKW